MNKIALDLKRDKEIFIKAIFEAEPEECWFVVEAIQKKLLLPLVSVESAPLSIWEQRYVRWQAAAQTLLFIRKNITMREIQHEMVKDPQLYKMLDLNVLTSVKDPQSRGRGLEDVIRVVNPNPKKGRPSKKQINSSSNNDIVLLPLIYDAKKMQINCNALILAVVTIVYVLILNGYPCNEVNQHPVIKKYKDLNFLSCSMIINYWIKRLPEMADFLRIWTPKIQPFSLNQSSPI